jgi:glycine/serine hydroxymethyltransferase
MVLVDDSHASGFIGKTGRGTHEHFGVMGKIDIITTTLGKGLGGASGGCVSGRKEQPGLFMKKLLWMVKTNPDKAYSDSLDRRTAVSTPSSRILACTLSGLVFPHPRHAPS